MQHGLAHLVAWLARVSAITQEYMLGTFANYEDSLPAHCRRSNLQLNQNKHQNPLSGELPFTHHFGL
jgi:hypothetical protein